MSQLEQNSKVTENFPDLPFVAGFLNHLGLALHRHCDQGGGLEDSLVKYPYKTPEQFQRCAELQSKADKAANQIKFAKNKKLAVRTFLQYLYLSI